MLSENRKIFEKLEQLKLKPGETLKESYFSLGGQEPLFVITSKVDGSFTLYAVNGQNLKKIQSGTSVKALQDLTLPHLK